MKSNKTLEEKKIDTDIAVVGGGGAGLAAAVAASEKGAKVILLEKRRTPGGTTKMAHGLFAAESPVQKRMGISLSKDDAFHWAMDYPHQKLNARLMRAYINKSGDTIQWLENKGVEFEKVDCPWQGHTPTVHVPRNLCADIIKALVKQCDDLGVNIFTHTTAKKILTGTKGEIRGILASTKDGGELSITSKAVIIAAGGFAGNREWIKKYWPSYNKKEVRVYCVPNTGDGIRMATEIGAATEGMAYMQLHICVVDDRSLIRMVGRLIKPEEIWVNCNGVRFIDESVKFRACQEPGNAVARQPHKVCYGLFDSQILSNSFKEIKSGIEAKFLPIEWYPSLEGGPQVIEEVLQREANQGKLKIADSWDEIAAWIGANPQVIKDTINEYNSSCDQGYDELFLKDRKFLSALRNPPYYAMKRPLEIFGTFGGVKINHRTEALDDEERPIAGLYATGESAGGWVSCSYNHKISGTCVGFAINSGRIAGENAFTYLKGIT